MSDRYWTPYDFDDPTPAASLEAADRLTAQLATQQAGLADVLTRWTGLCELHARLRELVGVQGCEPGNYEGEGLEGAIKRILSAYTAQQAKWTELGELLKPGGMDDPDILIGMIQAELKLSAAQQAVLKAAKDMLTAWNAGSELEFANALDELARLLGEPGDQ